MNLPCIHFCKAKCRYFLTAYNEIYKVTNAKVSAQTKDEQKLKNENLISKYISALIYFTQNS